MEKTHRLPHDSVIGRVPLLRGGSDACSSLANHQREEQSSDDRERKTEEAERESADSSSRDPRRNASATLCSAARAALFQAAWLTAGLAC